MPYSSNSELPDDVKKHSQAKQTAFRKAFNSALTEYKDEATAFKVAHAEMHKVKESNNMENFEERFFSTEKRKALAKSGAALPDGSFPIENKSDLENAIKAVGRASNSAAAKAHIKKRAKALGCTDCLPDTWESWQSVEGGDLISEATLTYGDSHDGLRDKLSNCIDGKVQAGEDMDGDGDDDSTERKNSGYPLHWVRAVHDQHVIYSMGGKNFAQKYETDDDGDPHLKGSPIEVEPSYTNVDKAKESFEESTLFEPFLTMEGVAAGGQAKKVELLSESFSDNGEFTFTVIKPGWSKNNRYYPASLLKQRANIFEGAKMFMNHATDAQDKARPEGDMRDWVANVTKVWPESDGTIRATGKVIDPQFKEKMSLLGSSNMLNTVGVSIRAMGESKPGEAEGRKGSIVESLLGAKSVDFVTFAGAGGKVDSLL